MTARISTRSKRQAMDWALALISQGIEPVVDFSEENGWGLLVSEQEHGRALNVIELYHAENLHWPWRRKILQRDFLFDWGSIAWVFLIAVFFWISDNNRSVQDAGLMVGSAISQGEWWRLFTAIFLHTDLGHLAANASLGFLLLGLAMGAYGTGFGLLAAYFAGAGGNLMAWMVDSNHRSLGASGMVMGALGLLAAQAASAFFSNRFRTPSKSNAIENTPFETSNQRSKLHRNTPRPWKHLFTTLGAGVMLFVLFGTSSNSDVLAHFGGFVSGFVLGIPLMLRPGFIQKTSINIIAGALFSLLTAVVWWLALSGITPTP